ncbi:MAG: hypothetical protein AB7D03_07015 [Thiomicrospira sp.]
MNYFITPPSTHYDGGLGTTGCNFRHAAETLKEHSSPADGILPISYLHRHAVELFLKSIIFILQKKYNLRFGETYSINRPGIKVNGKWVSMENTHNLSDLYSYFSETYESCKNLLPESAKQWNFPSDVNTKINRVSGTDPKSTFFRYPKAGSEQQDYKKSKVQKVKFEGAFENQNKPRKLVLMFDENEKLMETYDLDSDALSGVQHDLEYLSDFFLGVHGAFRAELTNGT